MREKNDGLNLTGNNTKKEPLPIKKPKATPMGFFKLLSIYYKQF